MILVPVRGNPDAPDVLYELLFERPSTAFVSHEKMPSPEEHSRFVESHPFLWWYLILADSSGEYVGAIEATDRNEIGISILEQYQRMGCARMALRVFMETHEPLPAVPAVRNGHWLANIAVGNAGSKVFFHKMGFRPLQETWVHG